MAINAQKKPRSVGIFCVRIPAFRKVAVPGILVTWALVIAAHAAIDTWNDYFPRDYGVDHFITGPKSRHFPSNGGSSSL